MLEKMSDFFEARLDGYEKYGYSYIKDIVNYGGDTDRLYVKELR